jgi:Zn-dependent protease with chaperone function
VNFFAAQDQARQTSRRLVFAYIVSTLLIVAGVSALVTFALSRYSYEARGLSFWTFVVQDPGVPVTVALITIAFILGASIIKRIALSSGGGHVARQMGGTLVATDIQDPLRRRLRNVVEEMAIASGVPVPEIYVLEQESGINAFAAGFTPSDAAVAVTRGTLELLDRDELQGVIGHEFSHILNGDMQLNIRLMGVLFGLLGLSMIGRFILRGSRHVDNSRGAGVVLVLGIGFVALGSIGMLFGRLIKASVSRQREYLADASAVQFTRQTDGIAGALKKIGGYSHGSAIAATDPEEVSHMLFGSGLKYSLVFATHPPLVDRIQALDPSFKETDFPRVSLRDHQQRAHAASELSSSPGSGATAAFAAGGTQVLVDSITTSVGQPEIEHVEYARNLRQSIPASLYDAAHSAEFSYLLTIALVLDRSGQVVERQFGLVREQLGADRATLVRRYYDELARTGAEYRLPLMEIAFPALKQRPNQELSYLVSLATRIIEVDGEIDLYEYCFYRILTSNLGQAANPSQRQHGGRAKRSELRAAVVSLLRVLADYGHDDQAQRQAAFEAGVNSLGDWAKEFEFSSDRTQTVATLNRGLDMLLGLNSKGKESLLRAIGATAGHDGNLTITEAELIRAVCATLGCPLPPILVHE